MPMFDRVPLGEAKMQTANGKIPALARRDYRVMWFGHVVGESSSGALGAAEGWLVFNPAADNPSTWVGAVFLAAMLPRPGRKPKEPLIKQAEQAYSHLHDLELAREISSCSASRGAGVGRLQTPDA